MGVHATWTADETRLVHAYKDRILQESGGNGISKKSKSLIELQRLCPNRTNDAVHHKVRIQLEKEGKILTRKQIAARMKAERFSNEVVAERLDMEQAPAPQHPQTGVVTVPLKKLYGQVDFETFMSIINE
jgi:hypothetical protein